MFIFPGKRFGNEIKRAGGELRALGLRKNKCQDRRRISNKTSLALTLSRPMGEGTARPVSRSFQSRWIRRPTGSVAQRRSEALSQVPKPTVAEPISDGRATRMTFAELSVT